ncbi:MAG: GNAT family N-acetyltransferase [Caulobacteraceae bacterium]
MDESLTITELDAAQAVAAIPDLAAVLADVVAGGASVNFMAGFGQAEAEAFYAKVADSVASGEAVLLAARLDGRIVGTVQLGLDTPPNQPHRAEVRKMLVRRAARRRGVGAALMTAVEDAARARGRTLLVLDTVTDMDGERLYARMGWTRVGVIPDYALFPDGTPCSTTIFYKRLG